MSSADKKPFRKQQPVCEDEIQEEIRKRILKESNRRQGKESTEEFTKATLDALEDMVTLSREEMERIAEQVRTEFKNQASQPETSSKHKRIFPLLALLLIIVTFLLLRRGSSWYLISGLILVFVILNHTFRKPPSP